MDRREFLRGAGGLIVVGGFTPQIVEWFERMFYRRRFWPVGADLDPPYGLRPIEGQPGMFRDMQTGEILSIREFREEDKWDTVFIPARNPEVMTIEFQPPPWEFRPATDDEVVQHMRELQPDVEVTQYLHGLIQEPPVFEVPAKVKNEPFYRQKITDILKKG